MPHLQFDINKKVDESSKRSFITYVEDKFSSIMETGSDHIAISIREHDKSNLSLGRTKNSEHVCLINLDIRSGRSNIQKTNLIKSLITGVDRIFGIKKKNQDVTLTNHLGQEFNFYEKSLNDWKKNDDPANK